MRRFIAIAIASLALAIDAPAWVVPAGHPSLSASAATLVDLSNPTDLRATFNRDRGMNRIVLLVSPT